MPVGVCVGNYGFRLKLSNPQRTYGGFFCGGTARTWNPKRWSYAIDIDLRLDLRVGTQGEGVSLSLQDKLNIAVRLSEMGIDMIEGGYPLSNEKDAQFFERVPDTQSRFGRRSPRLAWTRRRGMKAEDDPGMKALVAAQSPVITLVGKSWDFHARRSWGVSLQGTST